MRWISHPNRLWSFLLPFCPFFVIAHPASAEGTRFDSKLIGPRTEAFVASDYATIAYVSQSTGSDETGEGSSSNPWNSVAHALRQVQGTTERRSAILVAGGDYTGGPLEMREFVDLYGGFDPNNWGRDIHAFVSTLDGEGERRVVVGANHSRIDGFTIARGKTKGFGGGILCHGTSPEISNNIIRDNETERDPEFNVENLLHQEGNGGGGVACIGASPTIRNNRIIFNSTGVGNGGGIMCLSHSSPQVSRNLIALNITGRQDEQTRSSNGGGVSCSHYSSPTIEENVILENDGGGRGDGGGIYVEFSSHPKIVRNLVLRNTSDDDGSAAYVMKGSHPLFSSNLFAGNGRLGVIGSTVRLSKNGAAFFEGNRIVGNHGSGLVGVNSWAESKNDLFASNSGGGVSCSESAFTFYNDTIAQQEGVGIGIESGSIYLTNSILSDNGQGQIHSNHGRLTMFNSLIQGGTYQHEGAGGELDINGELPNHMRGRENFNADPNFIDDSVSGKISSFELDREELATVLILDEPPRNGETLAGRPIRIGEDWSAVKSLQGDRLSLWGDLTVHLSGIENPSFEIPKTFHLHGSSPCIGKGETLGAPSYDMDGDDRPRHRLAEGAPDVGADEVVGK